MSFHDVHESERPGAPTVLLSSGLGGTAGYWAPQLAALKTRYRVVTYDQTGTGRNKRDLPLDHSIAAMADEILAVMDATKTDKAHVVGHALGGLAGLDLAIRRPDRLHSLTVVNGWAAAHAHTKRCFDLRLMLLKHEGPAAYVRGQPIFLYPADWISDHDEALDAEAARQLAHFPPAEVIERRVAAARAFALERAIAAPVLVLASEDDMLVPPHCAQRLADALAVAELEMMSWGGHACNVTDPETFNRIVLEFLRS